MLISSYIDALDHNELIINAKIKAVKIAGVLFVLVVIALIVMGVFGMGSGITFPWESPLPTPTP